LREAAEHFPLVLVAAQATDMLLLLAIAIYHLQLPFIAAMDIMLFLLKFD